LNLLNNINAKSREYAIKYAKIYNEDIVAIDFGPGDEDSLARRANDSRGQDFSIWEKVHDAMQEKYEPPTWDEGFKTVIDVYSEIGFFDGGLTKKEH
jgi:hypothetical protein